MTKPFEITEGPYAHDLEQYLCFIGAGGDYREFDAEAELYPGAIPIHEAYNRFAGSEDL